MFAAVAGGGSPALPPAPPCTPALCLAREVLSVTPCGRWLAVCGAVAGVGAPRARLHVDRGGGCCSWPLCALALGLAPHEVTMLRALVEGGSGAGSDGLGADPPH